MFKKKYRVVTGSIEGYFVIQQRNWWYPVWRTVDLVQGLNHAVNRIDSLKKTGIVVHKEG